MRHVLKWDVPVDDKPHDIGTGPVVLVACQHSPDVVQVWTDETEAGWTEFRLVQVFGTGHEVPPFDQHIGSVVAADGALVWHLFAQPQKG